MESTQGVEEPEDYETEKLTSHRNLVDVSEPTGHQDGEPSLYLGSKRNGQDRDCEVRGQSSDVLGPGTNNTKILYQ